MARLFIFWKFTKKIIEEPNNKLEDNSINNLINSIKNFNQIDEQSQEGNGENFNNETNINNNEILLRILMIY